MKRKPEIKETKKQIKRILKKAANLKLIDHFVGSKFRRVTYPKDVSLCDFNCTAGDGSKKSKIQTCCHRFVIEKIAFCIDHGLDPYAGNTDYVLEMDDGKGNWIEADKELEEKLEGRRIGRW